MGGVSKHSGLYLICFNKGIGRFKRKMEVVKSKIIQMINRKGVIIEIKTTSMVGLKAYYKQWKKV